MTYTTYNLNFYKAFLYFPASKSNNFKTVLPKVFIIFIPSLREGYLTRNKKYNESNYWAYRYSFRRLQLWTLAENHIILARKKGIMVQLTLLFHNPFDRRIHWPSSGLLRIVEDYLNSVKNSENGTIFRKLLLLIDVY